MEEVGPHREIYRAGEEVASSFAIYLPGQSFTSLRASQTWESPDDVNLTSFLKVNKAPLE